MMQSKEKTPEQTTDFADEPVMAVNFFRMHHTSEEFFIDFGTNGRGDKRDRVQIAQTIMMAPQTAKRLLMTLNYTVQQYEQVCGEITSNFVQRTPANSDSDSDSVSNQPKPTKPKIHKTKGGVDVSSGK